MAAATVGALSSGLWPARAQAAGRFRVLHSFGSPWARGGGAAPINGVVRGADGNYYGTTSVGGIDPVVSNGTVYRISGTRTTTTIYSFPDPMDQPNALLQASDGLLYGTTIGNILGGVFRIDTTGTSTLLQAFDLSSGYRPLSQLMQASDGYVYGTAHVGGGPDGSGNGTIYRIDPNGTVSTFYRFFTGTMATSGGNPTVGLVQGSDGYLYGVAEGGVFDAGIVYRVSLAGAFTKLHDFSGPDGANPRGELIQASDGFFYGCTWNGGAEDAGTVFRMAPDGTLATLYSFSAGGPAGQNPNTPLLQGSDGHLYGTTYGGGETVQTVFRITLQGELSVVHTFADQWDARGALIESPEQALLGVTHSGGNFNSGTVYALYGVLGAPN